MTITQAIVAGRAAISRLQNDDGSFTALVSPTLEAFQPKTVRPTAFFTSLIVSALHAVPSTKRLRQHGARYITAQRNPEWSWNYWLSADVAVKNCPDDLDDTACALAALSLTTNQVNGYVLGKLAQQLIQTETNVGGPYKTWLINDIAGWDDVDIAVNANVGYLLSLHGVSVPGLERFIAEQLQASALNSRYYVGSAPSLYFLSRWYHGGALQQLQNLVQAALIEAIAKPEALTLALIISSACRLELNRADINRAVEQLLSLQVNGLWPAAAYYFELELDEQPYYAGSEALTTAYALEALQAAQHAPLATRSKPLTARTRPNRVMEVAQDYSQQLSDTSLQHFYQSWLQHLANQPAGTQITNVADLTADAWGLTTAEQTRLHLNLGSLHGWLAYTIFDNFLDAEGDPRLLSVATVALRQTLFHFQAALPDEASFQTFVYEALNNVDSANSWEVNQARANITNNILEVSDLPDYGDLEQLAARSWGHSIASSGVLLSHGYGFDSPAMQAFHRFFKHFLIARQLNDDAHDWEADLQHGQLTAVVSMLLTDYSQIPAHIDLQKELSALRQCFWEQTFTTVSNHIFSHLNAAYAALDQCQDLHGDVAIYRSWLEPLERATKQALAEQADTHKFIAGYSTAGDN